MKNLFIIAIALVAFSCNTKAQDKKELSKVETFTVVKTDAEWKQVLDRQEYEILRNAGTEPPFSSPLNKNYEKGTYVCAACATPLFKSDHKFDSGTGWPSFDRPIEGNVSFGTDNKIGYTRDEEHCGTCGGHLGHVFNDGPNETTGERHCINGAALDFIPTKNE